jgi:hypothetical protein
MAIAFDATSSASGSGDPITWSHTCTGSNLYLLVQVVSATATAPSSVTYNGVVMSLVYTINTKNRVYGLANPATGANTVSITFGFGGNHGGVAASYTGVKPTSQPDSTGTTTGNGAGGITNLSASTTTVDDNSWPIGFFQCDPSSVTAGASTTVRNSLNMTTYQMGICDSNAAKTPAGSATLNLVFVNNTFPTFGVLSLSPYIPSIDYPITIVQGSYTLSGQVVGITKKILYALSLAQGSYTLTGTTISFIYRTFTRFVNQVKNAISPTNSSKTISSTMVNQSKNTITPVNQTKN